MISKAIKVLPIALAVAMSVSSCSNSAIRHQHITAAQHSQYSTVLSSRSDLRLPACGFHSNQSIGTAGNSNTLPMRSNPRLPGCSFHSNQDLGTAAVSIPHAVEIPVEQCTYHPDPDSPGPPPASPDAPPEPIIIDQGSVYIHQPAMENPYVATTNGAVPSAAESQPTAATAAEKQAKGHRLPPIVRGSLIGRRPLPSARGGLIGLGQAPASADTN
jgi:hypothetical protein